jgi:hypothetical protein
MPRFFFHLTDGERTFTDANGVELESLAAARRHLITHTRELRGTLSDNGIHDWSKWAVTVSNERNETVQKMGFSLIPRI